ncbi:MAG: alcohol dehydrogenase catalytic domain-containing protein [bacterium]
MKTNAIRFSKCGGPEVLEWQSVDLPALGPRDVLVRHKAIGVNFIDTYFRSGLYPLDLPSGLGLEASGVIEAVGKDVNPWQVGDRVALIGISPIAYAQSNVSSGTTLLWA